MSNDGQTRQARLPFQNVPSEIRKKITDLGGNPDLNLYKVLANHPTLLAIWIDFFYSLRGDCTTPRQLRELMILRCAQLWNAPYEWFQHEQMAKQAGVSQEKIDAIKDWKHSTLFDDKERVTIELMESLTENKGRLNAVLDEQLKKHFNEAEYLELICTGSAYVMVSILLEALQVPIEK